METTEETLSVDGVVLNTLAYNVKSLAGRLRAPGLRTENILVPGRHGTVRTRRKVYEEGQIVLPLWVRDTDVDGENPDRETFYANIDKLTKLFRPGSGLLELLHTLPDGSVRRALVESTEAMDLSTKGRGLADFSVALRVPSVFWEDQLPVSQDLTVPHTGPVGVLTGMTAPIDDSVITITGPITAPRVEALMEGLPLDKPVWFRYAGTILEGQTLTVNCGDWTLTGGGGHVVDYSHLTHAGDARWLVIEAGPVDTVPGLGLSGSNTGASTKINLMARRKYLVG